MSAAAVTLIQRVRRFVGDWPDLDVLAAPVADTVTTGVTVADSTKYAANWLIQVDQEIMRVSALPNQITLSVLRGVRGSTPAIHASATPILVRPAFTDTQILDELNAAIAATFPFFYKDVLDTSIVTNGTSYEYPVPYGPTWLTKVETKESGSPYYYRLDGWTVKRGPNPVLQFATPPIQGNLRLYGFGPFPPLADTFDSLDAQWPPWGEDPLTEYAANRLLMSAEASRVRLDAGPQDDAQSGARQGVAASTAGQLLQRFQMRLQQQPMAPVPRHIVRIF